METYLKVWADAEDSQKKKGEKRERDNQTSCATQSKDTAITLGQKPTFYPEIP